DHGSSLPASGKIPRCLCAFQQRKEELGSGNFPARAGLPLLNTEESVMGFGRGALLWLLGVPLPIVLLLALFMHH
ncbi:MAG TPA: hypothetical protein VGC38_07265, partial [Pseudolabrys sp.]